MIAPGSPTIVSGLSMTTDPSWRPGAMCNVAPGSAPAIASDRLPCTDEAALQAPSPRPSATTHPRINAARLGCDRAGPDGRGSNDIVRKIPAPRDSRGQVALVPSGRSSDLQSCWAPSGSTRSPDGVAPGVASLDRVSWSRRSCPPRGAPPPEDLLFPGLQDEPHGPLSKLLWILPRCWHDSTLPWDQNLHHIRGGSTALERPTTVTPKNGQSLLKHHPLT